MTGLDVEAVCLVIRRATHAGFVLGTTSEMRPKVLSLPSGFVEENESPWEAAVREGCEETGLVLSPREDPVFVGPSHAGGPVTAAFFAVQVRGSVPGPGDDVVLVQWVRPDELLKRSGKFQPFNQRILDACRVLGLIE